MLIDSFPRAEFAEDQQYPHGILYLHCGLKGAQLMTTVGATSGILFAAWRGKSLLITAARYASLGVILGPLMGVGMAAAAMKGKTELIEWQDRAWRLQRHADQNKIDNYGAIGLLAGFLSAPLMRVSFLSGAGLGIATGVVSFSMLKVCPKVKSYVTSQFSKNS